MPPTTAALVVTVDLGGDAASYESRALLPAARELMCQAVAATLDMPPHAVTLAVDTAPQVRFTFTIVLPSFEAGDIAATKLHTAFATPADAINTLPKTFTNCPFWMDLDHCKNWCAGPNAERAYYCNNELNLEVVAVDVSEVMGPPAPPPPAPPPKCAFWCHHFSCSEDECNGCATCLARPTCDEWCNKYTCLETVDYFAEHCGACGFCTPPTPPPKPPPDPSPPPPPPMPPPTPPELPPGAGPCDHCYRPVDVTQMTAWWSWSWRWYEVYATTTGGCSKQWFSNRYRSGYICNADEPVFSSVDNTAVDPTCSLYPGFGVDDVWGYTQTCDPLF
jgi:hypothetical protein